MSRPTVWPWVRPFLILLVVIAIPPVVYWFGYVHSRTADERRLAYSTLSAITADFRNRLIAYDAIAKSTDNYAQLPEPDLIAYLRSILKVGLQELTVVSDQAGNRLRARPQTGDLLLLVRGVGKDKDVARAAPIPLKTLLAWEIVQTQFDGLLVVARGNHLTAQDRRLPEQPLGQQVALHLRKTNPAFAEFLEKPPEGTTTQPATGAPAGQNKLPTFDSDALDPLSPDFSEDGSIRLGGVDYAAFLQIVSEPLRKRAGGGGDALDSQSSLEFLVCGLISRDRLNSSVFQLYPVTLVGIASLLLFCLFTIPFLKLRFIGERERMRKRDVWLLASSILSATALATLTVFTWRTLGEVGNGFDTTLKTFTRQVEAHLETESAWAFEELKRSAPRLLGKITQGATSTASDTCAYDNPPVPSSDPVGSILTQDAFTSYPDFEAIVTTNLCGRQVHKWMTRTLPTPNIDTGDLAYFLPALTQTATPPGSKSFVFGTSLAKSSGLMLGIYAVPYAAAPPQVGAATALGQRTGVASIAISLLSVNSPVIAKPFQFVLVDSHGAVVFQQTQGSFRDERFFEAVQGGMSLQRAAREGHLSGSGDCSECGTYQYRGKTYRMLAIYNSHLQTTLVGYYDHAVVANLSARIFATAGIFMLGIVGSILLGAVIAFWWFNNTCFDWAWPDRRSTAYYTFGVLLCLLFMGLLQLTPQVLPSKVVRWVMLLTPIPVLLLLCWGKVAPAMRWCFVKAGLDKVNTRTYSRGWMSVTYTLFAVMMLLAFVAWPTYIVFNDALRLHLTEHAREAAKSWQEAHESWEETSADSLVNTGAQLGKLNCQTGPKDLRCSAPDKLYTSSENYKRVQRNRDSLAVYDICMGPDSAQSQCSAQTKPDARPPYSLTAPVALWLSNWRSRSAEHGQTLSWINESQSKAAAPAHWRGAPWSLLDLASLLLVPVGLWLLVRSVATHVLGMELTDEAILDDTAAIKQRDGTAWLLLRPSVSLLEQFEPARTLDLRSDARPAHSLAPAEGATLLVKHFEAQMSCKEWRAWVLSLLAGKRRGCILLTSEIDPVYYLAQRVRDKCEYLDSLTAEEREKRQQTLATCGELRNELAAWSTALRCVRKIRQPVRPLGAPASDKLAWKLAVECSATEPLQEIGERLRARPELGSLSWDEVVSLVLDAAGPYYRCLWELCSREERLVLIQLAEVGLVNPKRQDLVRHLSRRRLVKIDPRFRLMNESFERFVRSAESPGRVMEWERGGSGFSWSRLGTPLYALASMVVTVLLFAEHGLVTDILAAATGSAATLGPLRTLYASFAKSPTVPSKPA